MSDTEAREWYVIRFDTFDRMYYGKEGPYTEEEAKFWQANRQYDIDSRHGATNSIKDRAYVVHVSDPRAWEAA